MGKRRHRPTRNKRFRDERGGYEATVKENKLFEKYYKELGFVPEDEWEDFMKALREPLPITFRITSFGGETEALKSMIKTEYIGKLLEESSGSGNSKVSCLPWYPGELGWQLSSSRNEVRRDARLEKLKTFLLQETESGNISRQEAVSMLPPLLMDVKPHHKVLDMCAAPGSKTAQLIEYLHDTPDKSMPEGYVIANDVDNKRCYLMTHQVKRLNSPCCAIINHDASYLPNLRYGDGPAEFVKYDRVLCDVPCSGDGTLRKNIDIWTKWTPNQGLNLHGIQLKILKRGLDLLAVGGRLVYSTCSLNPVEDEAVVANLLKRCEGSVELVDVSNELQNLKYTPGISSWKIMTKDGEHCFDNFESIPPNRYTHFQESMFPPSKEESEEMNLHRCIRVLPHQQDTGGFFVAVLHKKEAVPWQQKKSIPKEVKTETAEAQDGTTGQQQCGSHGTEDVSMEITNTTDAGSKQEAKENSTGENGGVDPGSKKRPVEGDGDINPKPSKQVSRRLHGYKEDPYIFQEEEDPMWDPIKSFYGIPEEFPKTQIMYRAENGKRRTLYYVSSNIRDLVLKNRERFKFINLGVKIMGRSASPIVPDCDYRIAQEGLSVMKDVLPSRTVFFNKEDFIKMLLKENPMFTDFSTDGAQKLRKLSPGSMVFLYKPTNDMSSPSCEMFICGWRGKTSIRAFISYGLKFHYLRLFSLKLAEELMAEIQEKKLKKKQKEDNQVEKLKTDYGEEEDDLGEDQEVEGEDEGTADVQSDCDKQEEDIDAADGTVETQEIQDGT